MNNVCPQDKINILLTITFLPSACNSAPRQRLEFEDCRENPGYLGGSQQQDVGGA